MNGIGPDQADKIVHSWICELKNRNLYVHPQTEKLIRYTVMNMNEEGHLLITLGGLADELNVNSSAIRTILMKLENAKLIFRNRGVIGVYNLEAIRNVIEED